jgi:glucose-1-phosphate cytidylyltransferase
MKTSNGMKVVILCGGEGTRMKEETEFKPKPLVEVGGKPVLWHIMKIYSHYGFNEFILTLGYKGNMIKDYFLNERAFSNDFTLDTKDQKISYHNKNNDDFVITFVDTGLKALTGERVRLVKDYIDGEDFMLTYGDGVADIDINELLAFHKKQGTLGTLTGVRPSIKYGIVQHDEKNGKIQSFKQNLVGKNKLHINQHDFMINGGFMVFKKSFIDKIKPDSMVEEAFLPLTDSGQMSLYDHKGKWKAMDTYKEVEEKNEYWQKDPFWKIWKTD